MVRKRREIDPSAMVFFAAIARAGGVRGAVAGLGVPRSTISRRLAALERQVGAPLVVRTARRFALTELGVAFAERCNELEELMRQAEDLVSRSAREPSGKLRIAAAPVVGELLLPEVIADLARSYPRLSFEVRLSVDNVDLRRGDVDVALRAGPLDDVTDLFATRLGVIAAGCWVGPAYAKVHGIPKVPSDLEAHDCILVGSPGRASWTFGGGTREQRIAVSGRVRVDTARLACELASRGAGVARASRFFANPLVASGKLIPVLERYWPATPLHAVHAGPSPAPEKVRMFIERARLTFERVTRS
jgi:DNA-binding transcriptional LysR family regulator